MYFHTSMVSASVSGLNRSSSSRPNRRALHSLAVPCTRSQYRSNTSSMVTGAAGLMLVVPSIRTLDRISSWMERACFSVSAAFPVFGLVQSNHVILPLTLNLQRHVLPRFWTLMSRSLFFGARYVRQPLLDQ